jgi:hypothetical protein
LCFGGCCGHFGLLESSAASPDVPGRYILNKEHCDADVWTRRRMLICDNTAARDRADLENNAQNEDED